MRAGQPIGSCSGSKPTQKNRLVWAQRRILFVQPISGINTYEL